MSSQEMTTTLCRNIRYLRKKHGLSKKKLAEIIGCTPYAITKIEGGVLPRRFYYHHLRNLCTYFEIQTQDLFSPLDEKEA